jgi:AraC-like DNA-binding protein
VYREFPTEEPLRHFVECLWVFVPAPDHRGQPLRVLPDGSTDAVFAPTSNIQITGTTCRFRILSPTNWLVGIRFRAGAAGAVLGFPAKELRDRIIRLEELWGTRGREMDQRLLGATEPFEALMKLQKIFTASAPTASSMDRTVRQAVELLTRAPGTSVKALTRGVFLGERQLRRRFELHVGLGMKEFSRLVRFQCFVDTARARRRQPTGSWTDWAELACALGFSDQAHLIRESQALSGLTPSALLREI